MDSMTPATTANTRERPLAWLRIPRRVGAGLWTAVVCATVAAALVPVLALVPLAILRHHVRRAMRSAGSQGTLATR